MQKENAPQEVSAQRVRKDPFLGSPDSQQRLNDVVCFGIKPDITGQNRIGSA